MTRALVLGGRGFFGSHFIEQVLATTDWHIDVLDNPKSAEDDVVFGLANCYYSSNRIRILWPDSRGATGREPVDYVFHIAPEGDEARDAVDPDACVLHGTRSVLAALLQVRRRKPKKFFQVTTGNVFGESPPGVFHGEWDPYLPAGAHAGAQAAQECIAIAHWRTYHVPLVLARMGSSFGERAGPENYIVKTIRSILRDKPIAIELGSVPPKSVGSRMWLHAKRQADALIYMAGNHTVEFYPDVDRPPAFNVAGDEELSDCEIVRMISEIIGKPFTPAFTDCRVEKSWHNRRWAMDGDKLYEAGWRPHDYLRDQLRPTVLWYVENQAWLEERS